MLAIIAHNATLHKKLGSRSVVFPALQFGVDCSECMPSGTMLPKIGQVATLRIPQMADASGGSFLYNHDDGLWVRPWHSRVMGLIQSVGP